jgi:hypothetical protein
LKVSGRIFYDDTVGNLSRTESSSAGPPGYVFGEMRLETDYALVMLSDRSLILPASAVITTTRGQKRFRNEFKFSADRKYDAGATITFDEVRWGMR